MLARVLIAVVVLVLAGAAAACLVVGEWLLGALAVAAVCYLTVAFMRISRSRGKTSRRLPEYSESEQRFW